MRFASFPTIDDGITKVYGMPLDGPEYLISNPWTKTYILDIAIMDGNQLPVEFGEKGLIHIAIGPYLFKTPEISLSDTTNKISWYKKFPRQKIELPADPNQIPDLFIYFCNQD